MACSTCSCDPCSCGSSCRPANTVYDCAAADPGIATSGRHLEVLDSKFNVRRLQNAAGFLVNRQNGSGAWEQAWSTTPNVALAGFQATTNVAFGSILVQGSDGVLRYLIPPASANLYPRTDASGNLIFATLPTQSVPDPLTVTTANVTTLNLGSGVITGALQFTGLPTSAPTFFLGVDGSGNLVQGTPANTGSQSVMFFEAPTSPSAATPNRTTVPGDPLVIGNEIDFSSTSGALIAVTNSVTLTVVLAGFYQLDYSGYVSYVNAAVGGNPAIILLINGIAVNNGNSRPDAALTRVVRGAPLTGIAQRRLAAGDTIQLQLAATSGAAANVETYEVRLRATRTGT